MQGLAESSGESLSGQSVLRCGSDCLVPLMDAVVQSDAMIRSRMQIGCWMQGSVGARSFSAVPAGEGSKVHAVKSDEEYEKELKRAWEAPTDSGSPPPIVLTQFTAQWCGPCRMIAPYLDELSKRLEHVKILQIDIDEPKLSKTVRDAEVSAVPTFRFYKAGKVVSELQGADPRELAKRLAEMSEA
ncbi:hypothetical protein KFL_006540030 [Klebsormidium nitens]|uniref:Thioredoxin domain-containing protein n=1 Tax=Klebsormidium nitens TaxID=105231 RepID=A0A1Y1IM73_KLENI|nr:hypothetical protein KFL_006540030 [Klebsormidium nitens]|eukprot:GAQ90549.1 hypothetical protein KFL_006540030 [Klebsormidium nitens]